ncbi:M14 family zinc carboxypeptidase [Persicobacter diffluens]|uniref:Peptidase M14 n=1 Tax=Persicobacter diffluens TaxID=981 RepID=A0AAN4W161_9BACT|nr:peptidase M14 [Persicobacter diffluens]
MKKLCAFAFFIFLHFGLQAQEVLKNPAEFLGYPLGTHFTPHHKIVSYFEYMAQLSENISLQYYGETIEKRPLMVAFVGSKNKIDSLEFYRANNRRMALLDKGMTLPNDSTVTVWLSYNVHGNEASSSEVSMKMLYGLIEQIEAQKADWADNTLVVIDPCLNPDGRDRYVNWYNSTVGMFPNPNMEAEEHHEPWPGGRSNHYYHDLNRDWVWQTQVESQARVQLFLDWMPHLHLDFHEQYPDSPYYFAPATEPYHEAITDFQREFQITYGKANAEHFDANGWLYFTKEWFDLLYPAYGDTYPTFNGGIGMTLEQAGHGIAGLTVERKGEDNLTLSDRIAHHYQSGWTAIEVASEHSRDLISAYKSYFEDAKTNPKSKYKSYVLKIGNNPHRLEEVRKLLDQQGIEYGRALVNKSYRGFNYMNGKDETFKLDASDIIISAYQAKSKIANVLLEPKTHLSDSLTYDITAWSLPYVYGIPAFASTERIYTTNYFEIPQQQVVVEDSLRKPVGYILEWNSVEEARLLSALLQENVRVKFNKKAFAHGEKTFSPGSVIINRQSNRHLQSEFDDFIAQISSQYDVIPYPLFSGYSTSGADLGSDKISHLNQPNVAIVRGEGISSTSYGSLWHYMDFDINYPFTGIDIHRLNSAALNSHDVLILPDGNYRALSESQKSQIHQWISNGGKLIAIRHAIRLFKDQEGYSVKTYANEEEEKNYAPIKEQNASYGERLRNQVSNDIPGAIFKVKLDPDHPLSYGYDDNYFTMKIGKERIARLEKGWNVGTIDGMDSWISGFVGYRTKPTLEKSLIIGTENVGAGAIVYMADDPIFRSFWYGGKLMLANAIFYVNQ